MNRGGIIDAQSMASYLAEFRGLRVTDDEARELAAFWRGVRALRPQEGVDPPDTPAATGFDPTQVCRHE
jgi:hypothetical protein